MPIFPLDAVCNSTIDRSIEPALEELRADIAAFPFHLGELADVHDVLEVFDAARPRLNVLVSLLRDLRGATGMDIATGFGFLPVILSRYGVTARATERETDIACFATTHNIEVQPYTIGADLLLAPAGSLDFLVFAEVLEHLKAPPVRVLSEIAQLLRPGGRFVLTTPNVARRAHIEVLLSGENFLEPFPESIPLGADATNYVEHVREYSIREAVEAVEGAGIAVEQVLMTGWAETGYELSANPWMNDIMVIVGSH